MIYRITACFAHEPTREQGQAMRLFADFLTDSHPHAVMILRGSAGTGKTTLAAAIVKALLQLKQKLVLMAPTGRAAKVFSLYAEQPAYSIHRRIYRQKTAGDLSSFRLNDNLHTDTLFIVDEASMVSTFSSGEGGNFGSGSLLDDLIQYVYGGRNCRMLLIGDKAQLPPVGEDEAPALMGGVLQGYGLQVYETDLNEVLRQSQESGILFNATLVRQMITHDAMTQLPRLHLKGFADIKVVPGNELIEQLASSYSRVGVDETIVVTRSNKRANIFNQGIRNTVLDREDELCRGDQLMIVKNNYSKTLPQPLPAREGSSYSQRQNQGEGLSAPLPRREGRGESLQGDSILFLANGDRCIVQRVRHVEEQHGFRFAEVTLSFPDYDDYELSSKVLLDTLTTEAPALTHEQQTLLYNKVMEDYAGLPFKADRIKALKTDVYYNALQIKYGYAVTCHKAQGGQWAHVYIDQGYMTDDMLTPDYIHWLYTALTRATEQVFLVNWPKEQIER